jgi:hypothetical protein
VVQIFAKVSKHLSEAHEHVLNLFDGHVVLLVGLFVQIVSQVVPHALLHKSLIHFRELFWVQFVVFN